MGIRKTMLLAHKALEKANIAHALIGGMALASHGIHRATLDVDLLIDGKLRDAAKAALIAIGFELEHETSEVLQFSGAGYLDLLLANRPMSHLMLLSAKPSASLPIKCLEAEDLIGLKIQAYQNNPKRALQDKADIQFLIRKYPSMDWKKIKQYADLFNQWDEIQKLREST